PAARSAPRPRPRPRRRARALRRSTPRRSACAAHPPRARGRERRRRPAALPPDLGRRLAGDAEARLAAHARSGHDVAIVIADGLSARAVEAHARPLLEAALPPPA